MKDRLKRVIHFLGPNGGHPILAWFCLMPFAVVAFSLCIWGYVWLLHMLPWPPSKC